MGTYATTTSLDTAMIGVNFDTATTALAVKTIEHAEAKINSYIGTRYDISSAPFQTAASIPPQVKAWTEDFAEGEMWTKISRGSGFNFERGKEMRKEVLDCVMQVAEYEMSLYNSAGALVTESSDTRFRIQSNTSGYTPTFNEDDALDWEVDADKLEDISTDRE